MRYSTVLTLALLGSLAWSGALAFEKPPRGSTPVEQGPIYDPRTGSYFELRINHGVHNSWERARDAAWSRIYKDRRGRLAMIKDIDTLNFIREHFRINEEAWIGLQFYCEYRKLVWVSGEIQPLRNPGMWAPTWYRDPHIRCRNQNITYMPVYLTEEGRAGVSWQAVGPNKVFRSYLIEYPAPPSEAKQPEKSAKASDN